MQNEVHLEKNAIGLREVVFQSICSMAPGAAIAASIGSPSTATWSAARSALVMVDIVDSDPSSNSSLAAGCLMMSILPLNPMGAGTMRLCRAAISRARMLIFGSQPIACRSGA